MESSIEDQSHDKVSLIVIVSQSHLCRNPRVYKEATALAEAGYRVQILTAIYSNELLTEDLELLQGYEIEYHFYSDLRLFSFKTFKDRFIKRLATGLVGLGIDTKFSLGYGAGRLLKACKLRKADLYIMHQELPTVIGCRLIRSGYKTAFDIEDWYSEDLLPEARKSRPIKLLKKAEKFAIKNAAGVWTTSEGLATAMAQFYNAKRPGVIYNVFPKNSLIQSDKQTHPCKLFWFSQTIGPGRGLESFLCALKIVKVPIELHLLGNVSPSFKNELIELVNRNFPLFFHELISNAELPEFIARFDVGLALDLKEPQSRNYTITNKFFQYLQSGLPVIATDTVGQQEMLSKYDVGIEISLDNKDVWIENMNELLGDKERFFQLKKNVAEAAEHLNWEIEKHEFLKLVQTAINK